MYANIIYYVHRVHTVCTEYTYLAKLAYIDFWVGPSSLFTLDTLTTTRMSYAHTHTHTLTVHTYLYGVMIVPRACYPRLMPIILCWLLLLAYAASAAERERATSYRVASLSGDGSNIAFVFPPALYGVPSCSILRLRRQPHTTIHLLGRDIWSLPAGGPINSESTYATVLLWHLPV